jgi:hypothetical protein
VDILFHFNTVTEIPTVAKLEYKGMNLVAPIKELKTPLLRN